MFFRTLLFLLLLYLLIKVISRLFLPGNAKSGRKQQQGPSFFFHFGNPNSNSQNKKQVKERLDEVEEAEFEEIKEEPDRNSKSE